MRFEARKIEGWRARRWGAAAVVAVVVALGLGGDARVWAADAGAGVPDGAAGVGGAAVKASVRASVAKSRVTTAERVVYSIEVDAPTGWRADSVSLEGALPEGWNVLATRAAKTVAMDGFDRTALVFELEPFLPGEMEIGGVGVTVRPPLRAVSGGGAAAEAAAPVTVTTGAVKVEVVSVLPEGSGGVEMAEIKGVVTPRTPVNWWLVGGAAGGVVAVVALAWWLVARSRRLALTRVLTRTAHEIALERLDALMARGLLVPGRERFKAFFDGASAVLREYIEDRFHLHAPERTTEEFLRDARAALVLSEDDVEALGRFLNQCDLIKFAKHAPRAEDAERAAGIVREFVEKTRSDGAKVIVEGPGAVTARLMAAEREAA